MKFSLPQLSELFNSRHALTERGVTQKEGSYKDLSQEALYTSLEDLLTLFENPLIQGTFIDLGCGMGQAPLFYGALYPERKAIGIEFDEARIHAAQEIKTLMGVRNVSFLLEDLLTCELPVADTYFLYFPTGPVLDRVLTALYESGQKFILVAIESHGDLLPRLDLENWLTLKEEVKLNSERHYPYARLYERSDAERATCLGPFQYSYQKYFILIDDGQEVWLGDTFGLEWTHGQRFELKTPPRTINWEHVKKVMRFYDLSRELQLLVRLREQGEVTIEGQRGKFTGLIRKIILSPSFIVEISTGEKVEWSLISTIHQGSRLCYAFSSLS
jgi:SAM-dependent methyltransferase